MYAAREGAIDAVAALADGRPISTRRDPDGTTALMLAIINAHFDLAAVLIEKGAEPNVADSTGMTALYVAVDMHTPAMLSRPSPKLLDKLDARRHREDAARARRQSERAAEAADHRPPSHADRRRLARRRARRRSRARRRATTSPVMRLLLDAGADATLTLEQSDDGGDDRRRAGTRPSRRCSRR